MHLSSSTRSPVSVITVPMPPDPGPAKDVETGSVAASEFGNTIISGLDDPTLSVYDTGSDIQNEHQQQHSKAFEARRRQVWSKSRRRACCGLTLLAVTITGVVYLLQSFGDEGTNTSGNSAAAANNNNTTDSDNAINIGVHTPSSSDNNNVDTYFSGEDEGLTTDDFFTGVNEEEEEPTRDTDTAVENAADSSSENNSNVISGSDTVDESGNIQQGQEGNGDQGVNGDLPDALDGNDCRRDPATVQTKGGGNYGGNGGNGNGCRDRGDGDGNRGNGRDGNGSDNNNGSGGGDCGGNGGGRC